jgi:hypothetical protein
MKICWIFVHLITLSYGFAQVDSPPRVLPDARIVRLTLDAQSVTVLHLRPGYVSSVRLPEDVSSVVLGNPGTFKAEHSDAEPRLVFLKPTTASRAETNALITTRTGREISLPWSVRETWIVPARLISCCSTTSRTAFCSGIHNPVS